ncbi:MAG: 8-oxo-dGTP diphosphatase [bacterium]|nr:8-oxo-dGTP diphosphatase [bacterium]
MSATAKPTHKQNTLCLLLRDDEILLALKKRGFGEGKWNGVGGKPNKGEPIKGAAIRETNEEIGVIPTSMREVAHVYYQPYNIEMHVYLVTKWEGTPVESEEMMPKWFKKSEIPYKKMWDSDSKWLPLILRGKKLTAKFLYDDNNHILEESIEEWR